jgi:hypothetical protein
MKQPSDRAPQERQSLGALLADGVLPVGVILMVLLSIYDLVKGFR